MIAIDTNILLYAVDADEPTKQGRAMALIDDLMARKVSGVLLWQVAAEYLAGIRRWERNKKIDAGRTESLLEDALAIHELVMPTRDVLGISMLLSSKYALSHWDSMLLAACVDAGVTTLYSEDLTDGMRY